MLSFLLVKTVENFGGILKSGGLNIPLNKCANAVG
jgi:hypothetical protein